MLTLLHIENVAVIARTDVEFGGGLNVMTGETGAGKSIVIDALGAVLGGRTSRELVRTGAAAATITAVFDDGAQRWCEENGIEYQPGELVLQRRISSEGKSSCRVNGCPVSALQLRELGAALVDIHGQNDGQKLLSESYHLRCLDHFGALDAQLTDYQTAYTACQATRKQIQKLSTDEWERERRLERLSDQIAELQAANLKPGELETLSARVKLMRNAEKLADSLNGAYEAMYGDGGAMERISDAQGYIGNATRYTDTLNELYDAVSSLRYTADDVTERLRDFLGTLDFAPGKLDKLENRLMLLNRLSGKYGADETAMLETLASLEAEKDSLETASDQLEKLEKQLAADTAVLLQKAEALRTARKRAASLLETRIKEELAALNMPGIAFSVSFSETEPGANGCDDVRFLMSANAGEKAGRIAHIASGGELSRIMLAMKNALAEREETPTVVFDEIDTGVSGIAAQRVAEKLAQLSRSKQTICVTHLPQIAAMADIHFGIEKKTDDGRTFTIVSQLDASGRQAELARLIGGDHITTTTLQAASEQLAAAEAYKAGL